MLLYQIAITLIPGIGDITAKRLIAWCGSAEAVFKEKRQSLMKIPGIGEILADTLLRQNVLARAEQELLFLDANNIRALVIESVDYPYRLKQCVDAPVVLFVKGNADLNATRIIAVVGTRKATAYGREVCQELIQGLAAVKPLVISGLAYGIDTIAHRAALEEGLPTVGVLAHGLDMIYPPPNTALARKMTAEGALVSDFVSKTKPDRENFPKRNRLIAGMSDAVVVVEAAMGGGALITADLGNSYNRDVFAIPGRWKDEFSKGCNYLIRTNRAELIQNSGDLLEAMNWAKKSGPPPTQIELMINLSPDEEMVYRILQENGESGFDLLCLSSEFSQSKMAKVLLQLEMRGVVRALPGKRFEIAV